MPATDDGATLSRKLDTGEIPADGTAGVVEASSEERNELARRLDLAALDDLRLSYKLTPMSRGRFRLTGEWSARATQICGVTLEPIALSLGETVSVEFWPPEVWERHWRGAGEIAIDPDQDVPELIEDGMVDPGRLLEELLIVALPPFPRHESAELEWRETVSAPESPFAVLKDLPHGNGKSG